MQQRRRSLALLYQQLVSLVPNQPHAVSLPIQKVHPLRVFFACFITMLELLVVLDS